MINTIRIEPIKTLKIVESKTCVNGLDCVHPLAKIFNQIYPVADFNISKERKDGYQATCRYCSNQYNKLHRLTFWGKALSCASCANFRVKNSKISTEDLFLLYLAQDGKCVYTGFELTPRTMSLDHLKQVSKGGDNRIENLVWSVETANLARNSHYTHNDLFALQRLNSDEIASVWSRIAYVHQTFLEFKSLLKLTPEFDLAKYAKTYN